MQNSQKKAKKKEMDNKKGSELLDDTAIESLTKQEAQVADDAGRVGGSKNPTGAPLADLASATGAATSNANSNTSAVNSGVLNQTILTGENGAVGNSSSGGSNDITGGVANLDDKTDAPVEQNQYNQ